MDKAKVYSIGLRTTNGKTRLDKLEKLIDKSGMDAIDFKNKIVAIKMHFGEPGNMSILRPQYVAVLVKKIKELGGKPFLTDCNTLYVGGRKDAIEHMESATANGFVPMVTGAPVIIADGLKGSDDIEVPVTGGTYFTSALIGRAVMDADIIISLNHFKGHEDVGFGGALKNVGMGCGSRAGKMQMHNSGKPLVDEGRCIGCGACEAICAHGAPTKREGSKIHFIDLDKCVGCGRCIATCPVDAIHNKWDSAIKDLDCKIAEYTKAVLEGRPNFHISLVIDVSPNCDCHRENDVAIVPDIGFFASSDPVALDRACADAVNAAPVMPHSALTCSEGDHFHTLHENTHWQYCLEHGELIHLGTQAYELISLT